jgi:hypothetical protein
MTAIETDAGIFIAATEGGSFDSTETFDVDDPKDALLYESRVLK